MFLNDEAIAELEVAPIASISDIVAVSILLAKEIMDHHDHIADHLERSESDSTKDALACLLQSVEDSVFLVDVLVDAVQSHVGVKKFIELHTQELPPAEDAIETLERLPITSYKRDKALGVTQRDNLETLDP